MALIKCTECRKAFSDKASSCPHCGCPIEDVKSAMVEQEQIKEQKKAEKEIKPKKELKPEQKRKTAIIGSVAAVAVIGAAILGWYYCVKVPRDNAFAAYSETAVYYNGSIDAYNQSVESFNETAKRIIELNDSFSAVIDEAQALIDCGDTPYEAEKMTALSNTLKDAKNNKASTPSLYEKETAFSPDEALAQTSAKTIDAATAWLVSEIAAEDSKKAEIDNAISELAVPDYTSTIETIKEQQQELADSYAIQAQITNPTQDWVISRLNSVKNIANIACATEDNDPNRHLGKDGGYTAHVFYSSSLLGTETKAGDDLIDAGTDAGGSIEVYVTVESAEQRNTYLGSFDGTIFDSGKHIVLGTMVVRVSTNLTEHKQEQFIHEIIEALVAP